MTIDEEIPRKWSCTTSHSRNICKSCSICFECLLLCGNEKAMKKFNSLALALSVSRTGPMFLLLRFLIRSLPRVLTVVRSPRLFSVGLAAIVTFSSATSFAVPSAFSHPPRFVVLAVIAATTSMTAMSFASYFCPAARGYTLARRG